MPSYIALVRKAEGTAYSVDFPDFPGCITAGDSLDEAVKLANEVLAFHIKGLREDGDLLPRPSTLEEVQADPEEMEDVALAFLVQVPEQGGKAVRINITIEEGLLSRIDDYAKSRGRTRSAFLAEAAQEAMRRG